MSTIAAEENVTGKEIMPMSAQRIIIGSEESIGLRILFCALRPNKGCPAP